MTQLQLPIVEDVASKLERILNGPVSGRVHQASVYFDEGGEREARAIAQRDARDAASEPHAALPERQPNMRCVYRNWTGRKNDQPKWQSKMRQPYPLWVLPEI